MWVVAVLAGLIVLFILVLCVPVDAVFEWDSSKLPRVKLKLAWLFGLVNFALRKNKREKEEIERQEKEEPVIAEREEKAKKKKKPHLGTVLRIVRTKGLLRKMIDLISSSIRQFKVKELRADIILGLDDPADVGLAFAAVAVVAPWLSLSPLRHVRIEPVLGEEPSFQGKARAAVRLQPIRLVPPFLRFVFSRPALGLFRIVATRHR